ncbi:hypothetical protein BHL49_07925 [Bacillus cereus]|nr:hypothetical protein BHL49_07925 [Bacillus cereus]
MLFYKSMLVSLEFSLMLILTGLKIALVIIQFLSMIKEGIYSSIIHVPFDCLYAYRILTKTICK